MKKWLWALVGINIWVILTSGIYCINNIFYYMSKETEAETDLANCIQTIALLYKNTSDLEAKKAIEELPISFRFKLEAHAYEDGILQWPVKEKPGLTQNGHNRPYHMSLEKTAAPTISKLN